MIRRLLAVLLVGVFSAQCAQGSDLVWDLTEHVIKMEEASFSNQEALTHRDFSGEVLEYFEHWRSRHFGGELNGQSDEGLVAILGALDVVSVVAAGSSDSTWRVLAFETLLELNRRQAARSEDVERVYGWLIAGRDQSRAEQVRRLFNEHALPSWNPQGVLDDRVKIGRYLRLDESGSPAYALRDTEEPQIIVVAHPNCHFSRWAVAAIAEDDQLGLVFRKYGFWLTRIEQGVPDLGPLLAWNRNYPDFNLTIPYLVDDFPMITRWSMPTFIFMRNGKALATIRGWPKEGRKLELIRAARIHGFN